MARILAAISVFVVGGVIGGVIAWYFGSDIDGDGRAIFAATMVLGAGLSGVGGYLVGQIKDDMEEVGIALNVHYIADRLSHVDSTLERIERQQEA